MRPKRCPRDTRKSRGSRIPEEFRIHQRPYCISNRKQLGNWEGDLIIFDRDLGEANVMTLVERKSRYCVIIKNNSLHSRPIMNKIIQTFAALPYHARRSFTFDRGSKFMGYRALEDGMGQEAGFAIRTHRGRKVLLRTSTSAFDDIYQATPILHRSTRRS